MPKIHQVFVLTVFMAKVLSVGSIHDEDQSAVCFHLFLFFALTAELYCLPLIPCHRVHLSLFQKKDVVLLKVVKKRTRVTQCDRAAKEKRVQMFQKMFHRGGMWMRGPGKTWPYACMVEPKSPS